MSLRTKCALLVVAFELTLTVTIVLTVRFIGTYFENAAATFAASSGGLAEINRLRSLVRSELTHLLLFVPHPATSAECQLCPSLEQEIGAATTSVLDRTTVRSKPNEAEPLQVQSQRREVAIRDYFRAVGLASDPGAVRFEPKAHLGLDATLGRIESRLLREAQEAVENPYRVLQKAILLLGANAVVGAVLGVIGLVLVRRWVLAPIHELKLVTDEIGKGNLSHRVPITSRDELGQLSAAVNRMASDLSRIEKQMIQRERLAAMGELISYVAHNIRNPLAGIQASAEATRRQLGDDSPLRTHQDAIVTAIDRFQRWLRELEHTCSPLEVQAEPTDVGKLIDNVVAVFRPMADRRSVRVEICVEDGIETVNLDARHFEQALAAVVGNAIEVAGPQGRVTIRAASDGDPAHWALLVADTGPGIAPEIRQKIFEPSFTTKRTGHGLGLALARKVVELHGGQITVDCPPEGGAVFKLIMPVQPGERLTHD